MLIAVFLIFQEANNLTNVSSFRYSGLVHKKAVGVVPATEKKGFTVVLKTKKNQVSTTKTTIFVHEMSLCTQNDVYSD